MLLCLSRQDSLYTEFQLQLKNTMRDLQIKMHLGNLLNSVRETQVLLGEVDCEGLLMVFSVRSFRNRAGVDVPARGPVYVCIL